MCTLDYAVLAIYLAGIFAVGLLFAGRNRSASDMFAAGGQSPWWTSGLSAFMTMFSANTFVVWGGIAYRHGLVAVAINLMYGVAALLAGYFVAGRWKRLGVQTPAQYIQLRFGYGALHFYTWFMMVYRMVGTAGALYALGKILVALMPLAEGNPLRDAATGNLALPVAILIFGGIVVVYTMIGGLWAVLMTDVLQFIVLNMAVLFVVPLAFRKAGGVAAFVQGAPEGFFHVTGGEYTWYFLAGWCAIHFFMIGAEWAFVQRFICVPNARDARRSTYLFGILYLVSPLLWLLPPMIYRVIDPAADHEQAYILACRMVLPAGMLGLMVAAMFSATASMVSSQLNVFSGVLTNDIYAPLGKGKTDSQMVRAGRGFTILLGALLIAIALAIPRMGGAEKVVVSITELMVVGLLAPTLWGIFNRKIGASAVWTTALITFTVGTVVRFGLEGGGFLAGVWPILAGWVQAHSRLMKTFTGVVLPVLILVVMQFAARTPSAGFARVAALQAREDDREAAVGHASASRLPGIIVAWSLVVCGVLMLSLIVFNQESRAILAAFGALLLALAAVVGVLSRRGGGSHEV